MAQYFWVGGASGDWSQAENWETGDGPVNPSTGKPLNPPGSGDDAVFNNNGSVTVTANNVSVKSVLSNFSAVTVKGTGLTAASFISGTGSAGIQISMTTGAAQAQNFFGTLLSGTLNAGTAGGIVSGGSLTSDNFDGTVTGGLVDAGSARLTISGGQVTAATITGASMTGGQVNTQVLDVSSSNATVRGGVLTVSSTANVTANHAIALFSGGKVQISGPTVVNMASTASNVGITVDGAGSNFIESGSLTLGVSQSGNLAITHGGKAAVQHGISLGTGSAGSRGSITVDGEGSTLTVAGVLLDGDAGTGTIEVLNGGKLLLDATEDNFGFGSASAAVAGPSAASGIFFSPFPFSGLIVGNQSAAHGSVKVDNGTILFDHNSGLVVGKSGAGSLDVLNGGQVLGAGTVKIGDDGSNNLVRVDGSTPTGHRSHLDAVNVYVGSAAGGDGNQLQATNEALITIKHTLRIWQGSTVSAASSARIEVDFATQTISGFEQSPYLSIGPEGVVICNGTISNALVVVWGTLEAGGYYQSSPVGGICLIDGILTGNPLANLGQPNPSATGVVLIDPGATLEVGANIATTRTSAAPIEFSGNGSGTLKLDLPSLFGGEIRNLAGGDKIILANTAVATFSLTAATSGFVMSVTDLSGTAHQYSLHFYDTSETIQFNQVGADAVFTVAGNARTTMKGKVVDGYLNGATVFADANLNGLLDPVENHTTTDAGGDFVLAGGAGLLVAFGGTDLATGLVFAGQLRAPIGSTVVTPLTTLLTYVQAQSTSSVADAEGQILAALGMPDVDFTTLDPIAAAIDPDGVALLIADAMVLDTVQMIASFFAGIGAATADRDVFAAVASFISDLPQGGLIDLADQPTIAQLVANAAALSGVDVTENADTLSNIIASANAALSQVISANSDGIYLSDVIAVERVAQGAISASLLATAGNALSLADTADHFTGANLLDAIADVKAEITTTTVPSIEAASLGVLRLPISDTDATEIVIDILSGQTTFANHVSQLIDQAQSTTVPALITFDLMYGMTPSSAGLDFLTAFDVQLSQMGFSLINVWVNLGASFADNGLFGPQYGAMSRDAFVDSIYNAVFGHAPTQEAHNVFKDSMDFYATFAGSELGSRGAIAGVMMYLANQDPTSNYAKSALHFLQDAAVETPTYQTALVGTYLDWSPPNV